MCSIERRIHSLILLLATTSSTRALINVATERPAQQSSTRGKNVASYAVDGDVSSCSITQKDKTAWWKVDLQTLYLVQSVHIKLNTSKLSSKRLAGYSISVSDGGNEANYSLCYDDGSPGALPDHSKEQKINCSSPLWGRYVKISQSREKFKQIPKNYSRYAILELCEIQVFVNASQVATRKHAEQSSNHSSKYPADNAVDGSKGDENMNNCSHTEGTKKEAWWRVDLNRLYFIQSILIYPRPHNVSEMQGRFAGFSLSVSKTKNENYQVCFDFGKNSSLPDLTVRHVVNCNPPVPGRYVKISNSRNSPPYGLGYSETAYVNLCEVEIIAEDCQSSCTDCACNACKDGFYGVKCQHSCPIQCGDAGSCSQRSGHCESCKPGYYGADCTMKCSPNCVGNICSFDNGYCENCNGSYYGPSCNINCPSRCASCKSQNECTECDRNWYGNTCQKSCKNCGNGLCGKLDGKCIKKLCEVGYFTYYCNKSCSKNCKGGGSCDFSSGNCTTCKEGFYGRTCDKKCPPCGGNGSCHIKSGRCHFNSCRAGFYGDKGKCDQNCSATCGGDGSCNITDGTCLSGCDSGFKGKSCKDNCSENCFTCDQHTGKCKFCHSGHHGRNCETTCPANCGGTGECSMTEGECSSGCKEGWKGIKCSLEDQSSSTGATVGAVLGIMLLLMLILVIVAVYLRRRKRNKESKSGSEDFLNDVFDQSNAEDTNRRPNIAPETGYSLTNNVIPEMDANETTYYNTAQNLLGIKVEDFKNHVSTKKEQKKFMEEFSAIPYGQRLPATAGQQPGNMSKNRYKTTFPYDHSRVLLQGNSDYINANYIEDTGGNRKYIASQGPTSNTLADFWQMVWQKNVEKIIMLTNLKEGTKTKCDKYWPDQHKDHTYGHLKLSLKDERTFSYYVFREMVVESTKSHAKRTVFQFHYTTWPDHGTPDPFLLVTFHERVIGWKVDLAGPLLVHCSAGIGRTGTFIALDAIQEQGRNTGKVNVESYVRTMRKDRMNMIQNAEQYEMLHEALIEGFQWQDKSTSMDQFPALWHAIKNDRKPLNHQKLKMEYDMLMKLKNDVNVESTTSARNEENNRKNRHMDILPSDKYRPYLSSYTKEGTNYINAVIIPSHVSMKAYFVTQIPLPHTIVDFWRLLNDHESYCVLHFTSDSDDKVNFYPTSDYALETDLHFIKKESSREHQQNIREMKLSMKDKNSEQTKDVTLLRMEIGGGKYASPAQLFKAVEVVEAFGKKHKKCPVTVVSSNGCIHCDVFCTIASTIEYMKIDNRVDIYQTARHILFRRPEFFRDYDTYRFCYEVINEYLSTESVYCNT